MMKQEQEKLPPGFHVTKFDGDSWRLEGPMDSFQQCMYESYSDAEDAAWSRAGVTRAKWEAMEQAFKFVRVFDHAWMSGQPIPHSMADFADKARSIVRPFDSEYV